MHSGEKSNKCLFSGRQFEDTFENAQRIEIGPKVICKKHASGTIFPTPEPLLYAGTGGALEDENSPLHKNCNIVLKVGTQIYLNVLDIFSCQLKLHTIKIY